MKEELLNPRRFAVSSEEPQEDFMQTRISPRKGSKQYMLLKWMKQVKRAKTSTVISWGTLNFCNRAERDARLLAEKGWLRRMSPKKKSRFYVEKMRQEVWEYVR